MHARPSLRREKQRSFWHFPCRTALWVSTDGSHLQPARSEGRRAGPGEVQGGRQPLSQDGRRRREPRLQEPRGDRPAPRGRLPAPSGSLRGRVTSLRREAILLGMNVNSSSLDKETPAWAASGLLADDLQEGLLIAVEMALGEAVPGVVSELQSQQRRRQTAGRGTGRLRPGFGGPQGLQILPGDTMHRGESPSLWLLYSGLAELRDPPGKLRALATRKRAPGGGT